MTTVDAKDIKLLAWFSGVVFGFTTSAAQEKHAHSLWRRDLLERRESISSANAKSVTARWAYRLTDKGAAIVDREAGRQVLEGRKGGGK